MPYMLCNETFPGNFMFIFIPALAEYREDILLS